MKIIFNLLLLLSFADSSSVMAENSSNSFTSNNPSALNTAKQAFDKKDYSTALTLYQIVLKNHVPQSNNQTAPLAVQTPSITQKVLSFFTGSTTAPVTISSSKNLKNGYICYQMGNCYVQMNNMDQAVSAYDIGVTVGGDSDTGNICLFEKGFCQMKQKNYLGAYQSLKEYVKRNVDKAPTALDASRMRRAIYMSSACAWILNKSGKTFEPDPSGAEAVAEKAYILLPKLNNRIYFKKQN
jgi:tetratricopeptide (TPR) repeat protein